MQRNGKNRKGKTRDLLKKIRDTKGTFHAKMGSIKDRNGVDLIEAEDVKKRWQEYTGEQYKKELHDIVQETGIKTIPKKKKYEKKQNGCLRRPYKYQGEEKSERQRRKEKIHPFECRVQRLARRDKKAFLSDQCKEIQENNKMGKTRDSFKKIRDTKGTFHAKMGSIKDRNGVDLIEAEDIKKRWQEYTEELYKKIFITKIITMV